MIVSGSYIPSFPYLGDQAIISSGRILFHAKDDSAFIFAKESVGLSTSGSVDINASKGVRINGKVIQLGLNAQEAVIKGDTAKGELTLLYSALARFASAVGALNETKLEDAVVEIHNASVVLFDTVNGLKERLPDMLSKTTKTL